MGKDIHNAYPELPVLPYARTSISMDNLIEYLTQTGKSVEIKCAAYVIFYNESGAGRKGINNNYIGLQADGDRQADRWAPFIDGTCLKKENNTGKLRRFVCFKNWQDCVDILIYKVENRGLYVGGYAHPYADMAIKTIDDWPAAYYQEWVIGKNGAIVPNQQKINLLKQYKDALNLF